MFCHRISQLTYNTPTQKRLSDCGSIREISKSGILCLKSDLLLKCVKVWSVKPPTVSTHGNWRMVKFRKRYRQLKQMVMVGVS